MVVLGAGLATPTVVREFAAHGDSGPTSTVQSQEASATLPALSGFRPAPVPCGTPPEEAPTCSVSVEYADDVPSTDRVTLADLVLDQGCPSSLRSTVGLTFEVDNPRAGRSVWWRRAESSFDVLEPSSGSIPGGGKGRVSLSDLVLDQSVTIEVLDGDRRLLTFTLRHF
jgi:hypothetical protein